MDYLIQPIDVKEYIEIFPRYILDLACSSSAISFVAKENDRIVGFALFDKCKTKKDYLTLKYVYVDEEYRKRGIATALLSYAEGRLHTVNKRGIYVKDIWRREETRNVCTFLLKQRFIPITVDGHYVSYFVQDLRECVLAEKIGEMKKLLDNVKFQKEISEPLLKFFRKTLSQTGRDIDFDDIDLLFSSFYQENEDIKGFMHLDEIEENVLLLSDTYIDNNNGMILAALLSHVLKVSMATLPDEAMVCLQLYRENEYNGVKTVFGEPEHDDVIMEFVKIL